MARKCEFLLKSLMCKRYLSKVLGEKDINKAFKYIKNCGGDDGFVANYSSNFVTFIRYCMGLNDLTGDELKAIADYEPLIYHIQGCAKDLEKSEVLSGDQEKKLEEVSTAEHVRCIEIIRELIDVNAIDGQNNGIDLVRKLMVNVWLGVLGPTQTLGNLVRKVSSLTDPAKISEWLHRSHPSPEVAEDKLKKAFELLGQIAEDRNNTLHYTSKRESVNMDELRKKFEWIVRESGLLDTYNHELYPAEVSDFYLCVSDNIDAKVACAGLSVNIICILQGYLLLDIITYNT